MIDQSWELKYRMIPGTKYRITLEDCCVKGELFATFDHYDKDVDDGIDDDPDWWDAIFDIGKFHHLWGQWTVHEIDTSTQ